MKNVGAQGPGEGATNTVEESPAGDPMKSRGNRATTKGTWPSIPESPRRNHSIGQDPDCLRPQKLIIKKNNVLDNGVEVQLRGKRG